MQQIKEEFIDVISRLLDAKLQKFIDEKFDRSVSIQIYTTIFDVLQTVMKESNVELSNEGLNLIAQTLYDNTVVNKEHLDPNIFTKRAKPCNIPTIKEIALIATLFKGSEFSSDLIKEIKHRS